MTHFKGLADNDGFWGGHTGLIDATTALTYAPGGLWRFIQSGPLGPQKLDFSHASNSMYLVLFKPVEVGFLVAGIAKILLVLLGKLGVFPYA